jgi:hypothetical protein
VATSKLAHRLLRSSTMRLWAVGILAGAMLSACGVGADEDPSLAVVGSTGQELTDGAATPLPTPPTGQTREVTTNPTGSGPVDPGAVGIPQDPIPLWQGKGPQATTAPAPGAPNAARVTGH